MKTTYNLVESEYTKKLLSNVKNSQKHVGSSQLDAF